MANADKAFWDMVEGKVAGAPATRLLGWKCLHLPPEDGTIAVEFQPREEFLNPAGIIQGGFVAAMLDEAMGPVVYATLEPGEFNVAFVESELRDAGDRLLATATA